MDYLGLSSLIMWSIVTGIAMLVVGFSYSMYLKRHADEIKDEYDIDAATTTIPLDTLNDNRTIDTLNTTEMQSQLSSDILHESPSNIVSGASAYISITNHDTDNTKTISSKSEQIDD